MSVGIVVVSHSDKIAEGVVELAAQMAGSVRLVPAGGTDDGRIGTSFDKVLAAFAEADTGDGVAVLCDLGSAVLTAETALDFLEDDAKARVEIVDAPLVEGTVAAAVSAQTGGSLAEVVAAAQSAFGGAAARGTGADSDSGGAAAAASAAPPLEGTGAVRASVTLRNRDGLHARPAAEFVKLAAGFDARIEVNGVDAKSLLRIMSLGLGVGAEVVLTASGPQAQRAVDALVALVDSAFGE